MGSSASPGQRLWSVFLHPDSVGGDRNRRAFLALGVLVFAPVLLLFGIEDLMAGRRLEAAGTFEKEAFG